MCCKQTHNPRLFQTTFLFPNDLFRVLIASQPQKDGLPEQRAEFGGDVLHHPLEIYRPDLVSVFCEFPEFARRSRQWLLAYVAETGAMYFCSHFPAASAGRIMQHNGCLRFGSLITVFSQKAAESSGDRSELAIIRGNAPMAVHQCLNIRRPLSV